jgi:formate/nitrite transporter FocA (FNT family)
VNLGYPLGFLIVIIGRQQLFTENTLTAIIPLLARRNLATLVSVLRLWTIVLVSYVVGLAGLTHIVAGSTEVLYLVMRGARSWASVMTGYLLPTLLGNIIGGVSLVSALNHAQVVSGMPQKKAG